MHDIVGPTARPVTGLLGSIYSRHVAFTKPISHLPYRGGGVLLIPNPNDAVPIVMGSDGLSLGFGTITTVFDDLVTSGPELGSQTESSSATSSSRLAVVGGTGKYNKAGGFAEIRLVVRSGPRGVYGGVTLLRIIVHLT
uniref:Dirigent protein n=1 Tax=Cannabis sativa TaxID=3483 RepID=A0A803Q489_CANSA